MARHHMSFGILHKIILDDGKQFKASLIGEFYDSMGTRYNFSATYHPQGNGLEEASNKMLQETLKKRLKEEKEIYVK